VVALTVSGWGSAHLARQLESAVSATLVAGGWTKKKSQVSSVGSRVPGLECRVSRLEVHVSTVLHMNDD
jgi:hypothetical protein